MTGNSSTTDGGGLFWYPGSTAGLNLLNATIASNTAGPTGGNIYTGGVGTFNDYISAGNTIVAGGSPSNCTGTVWSRWGYNLEDANTCGFTATGDKRNTNPTLGPLQDNGGATKTRVPLPGSPVIDGGTNTGCPAVSGATSYEVWRSSFNGAFSLVLTTAATLVNDTGLSADTTYLYKVRVIGGARPGSRQSTRRRQPSSPTRDWPACRSRPRTSPSCARARNEVERRQAAAPPSARTGSAGPAS